MAHYLADLSIYWHTPDDWSTKTPSQKTAIKNAVQSDIEAVVDHPDEILLFTRQFILDGDDDLLIRVQKRLADGFKGASPQLTATGENTGFQSYTWCHGYLQCKHYFTLQLYDGANYNDWKTLSNTVQLYLLLAYSTAPTPSHDGS